MPGERKPVPYVEGQSEVWAELCPLGQWPAAVQTPDGKRQVIVQNCDEQAFAQLVAGFRPEVLVDFEHRSENSDDTTAAAWVQELRVQNGMLEARLRLTDLGAADLVNRRRRFLSPVWPLDAANRPLRLNSVALTNTPNFRTLAPVLNKESTATGGGDKQRSPAMDLKELAKALGMPETATAEEVMAALKAALDEKAQLKTQVDELQKTAMNKEADAFVEANKAKIKDPAAVKAAYVQNKAATIALVGAMAEPQPQQVCNKREARPPVGTDGKTVQNKLQQFRAMPPGKERDQFLAQNKSDLMALQAAEKESQG